MGTRKQYADPNFYERKLKKIMERFGATEYDWNYDRHGGWVRFVYKDQAYLFEHSVENAKAHGTNLAYGSDAFAQIVLALEDLCRIVDRGIYDLQSWVAGMKALPAVVNIPSFFATLGFDHVPSNVEDVRRAYREMAKSKHPDGGGSDDEFQALKAAYEQALSYMAEQEKETKI